MIDLHSHILPGVDDGARNFDESVEMVRGLASLGVTDIVATPHYVNETNYTSSVSANKKIFEKLKGRLKKEKIAVNLYLGNEIFIDDNISGLLKSEKITGVNSGKYLLIEFSLNEEFSGYKDLFLDLMAEGYKIILAHPERYAFIQKDFQVLQELSEMGVLSQVNLGSIAGKYGKKAEKVAKKIIKKRIAFGFGSDLHRPIRHDSLEVALRWLKRRYSEDELRQVLVKNPQSALDLK